MARDHLARAPSGLITLSLWCSSPDILSNAATVQSDAPAAAMAVSGMYLFWKWCLRPKLGTAVVVGLTLGAAMLVKTTLALLLPLLPFLWLIRRPRREPDGTRRHQWKLLQLGLIWFIAVDVLNAGYLFAGSFKPLGDYQFLSGTLSGGPGTVGNRFSKSWFAAVAVPIPEDYLLGIDAQCYDFENHLTSYLRGATRTHGWWYYYIYGFGVKTPVGSLCLLAVALGLLIARGPGTASWRDTGFLALPMLAILTMVSSQTGLNNHLRYALPALPFLLILCGSTGRVFRPDRRCGLIGLVVITTLFGSIGSSLSVYPHSHSYFNELVGGPAHGHEHLLGSNVDSGEDLLCLKEWLQTNARGRPCTLAYFGNLDPRLAGLEFSLPPRLLDQVGQEVQSRPDLSRLLGLHAVSVNCFHGPSGPLPDGQGGFIYGIDYSYFLKVKPVARIGGAIFIYDIRDDEIDLIAPKKP